MADPLYRHVLFATDFHADTDGVADRARALAQRDVARLSLLHVVEQVPLIYGDEMVFSEEFDLEARLVDAAAGRLSALGRRLGVDAAACHVVVGAPREEILAFAEAHEVDLIVLGNPGRHGLALVVGHTLTGVIHHATCDVIAVRHAEKQARA